MIIKTRKFDRWARKAALSDMLLCQAVEEMLNGLVDADLGAGVFKETGGLTWERQKRKRANLTRNKPQRSMVFRARLREE